MLDPEIDLVPQSSPSISSISSSDFDSESTGSFFHDRSTSLGTLMGVSFPSIRVSSRREQQQQQQQQQNSINNTVSNGVSSTSEGERRKKKKKKKKGRKQVVVVETEKNRRWWKLCRDDVVKPASLADFLEVERRFDDGEYYGVAAELEGVVVRQPSENGTNGRMLFADGRVLPPSSSSASATRTEVVAQTNAVGALCRFPVLLTGICSGGGVTRGSGV